MLHLIKRFFGFLVAEPLDPHEQRFVAQALDPMLLRLFASQRVADQRHAYLVASRVAARPHLVEAALLHDIGKTTTRLGAIGRSLATLWAFTSLPIWGDWLRYVDHGRIGADVLERAGADNLTVAFARYHPGPPPDRFDPADWEALERADGA